MWALVWYVLSFLNSICSVELFYVLYVANVVILVCSTFDIAASWKPIRIYYRDYHIISIQSSNHSRTAFSSFIEMRKMINSILLSTVLASFHFSLTEGSPYIISDDRVRSLDITPVLGRGYSVATNGFLSTCLVVDETTTPSYNYDCKCILLLLFRHLFDLDKDYHIFYFTPEI